tara:strand:- start:17831 stop:18118 length:288 start_codon:yes stop_codon:yes gene_type:complete
MILFFLLALVNIYILLCLYKTPAPTASAAEAKDKYIIYGSMGCGWTRKQIDVMKEKKLAYEYVDCQKDGGCPPDVKAFPTIRHPDGKMTTGFNSL